MGFPPSQPFAGIGITYPRREEAEAERQHDNVQHGMFLCVVKREPVIIFGQGLATIIYIRNIMLIFKSAETEEKKTLTEG